MRVAFLGMGIMGRPMAANLVKAGHEVSTWNRSPGKDLEGARTAPSPSDAARGAEVVWMCVSDTKAVESVLFGPSGAEEALTEGMTIADSSTISPSATLRFAERVKRRGVHYVDAPMTGSKIAAESGSLIFMAGGEEPILANLAPLFQAMGKQVFHMGDTSKGQATKLAMNLQTGVVDYKAPFIMKRDFSPNFPLRLMLKDIHLTLEAAKEARVRLPGLEAVEEVRHPHVAGEMGGRGSKGCGLE